jgi:choline dehydrogenase
MIYTRGNRWDYDHWQQLGNQGWDFSQALPLFKKAENQRRASGQHLPPGPLSVSDLRSINPLTRAFVEACAEIGIPRNEDFNGETQEGAGFFRVTQKRGKRHSTAAAYLKPALNRRNLTVQTYAHTTRVLFEGSRAIGVEYIRNGVRHQARADEEVILCGGTINTPQLLMLSGIGLAAHLRELGIAVVADLPGVGRNLQDHLFVGVTYRCIEPVSLARAEKLGNLLQYLLFRKGMLTSNVAEAGAFIKTKRDLPAPDLELIFGPVFYMNHGYANPPGDGFTVGAVLLHPHSQGAISLRSDDPFDTPVIQPAYLSHEADLRLLIEGVKMCREIAQASAFADFRGEEVWPGAKAESDGDIAEFIRNTAETLYHPVGTCKMGSDELAVVDSQLKVHQVEALRVMDGSVMPRIVTGHPNAGIVMIAEKGAEFIRSEKGEDRTRAQAKAT